MLLFDRWAVSTFRHHSASVGYYLWKTAHRISVRRYQFAPSASKAVFCYYKVQAQYHVDADIELPANWPACLSARATHMPYVQSADGKRQAGDRSVGLDQIVPRFQGLSMLVAAVSHATPKGLIVTTTRRCTPLSLKSKTVSRQLWQSPNSHNTAQLLGFPGCVAAVALCPA